MHAQHEILTAEELKAKGITAKSIKGLMSRTEKRIAWFVSRHMTKGTSEAEKKEWDLECAKHDHAVHTLRALEAA